MTRTQIAICAALYAFGWITHSWYQDGVEKQVRAFLTVQQANTAKQIASITASQTVINNKVVEKVRTEKVYLECKHTPDTLLLINQALTNGL
jgi:hypothetical protein